MQQSQATASPPPGAAEQQAAMGPATLPSQAAEALQTADGTAMSPELADM